MAPNKIFKKIKNVGFFLFKKVPLGGQIMSLLKKYFQI